MINNKIKVYARIKPSIEPRRHLCEIKVNRSDKKKILLLYKDLARNPSSLQPKLHEYEEFVFENIFPESANQEIIYNSMAKPIVERAIEGFNATIMAYGQTGTGKTHTICGGQDLSMKGIIPRAFKHVFIRMKELKHVTYKIFLSAMEIYNDHAFDLLGEKYTKFGLQRMNTKQIIPRNLKMVQVSSMHDLNKLLKGASNNRVIRNTAMNDASSRSHCIFSLHLYQHQPNSASITKSKIHMIDLSGSEKIGKKRHTGILFNESRHINLSLHYIELVIRALSDKNQDYVPYRNSMITSFLRDSLGGNSNTVMIFTLSLDPMFFEETVLTCRFAQRVSLISNKILKIHKTCSAEHKKVPRSGMNKTSKHKGISCKLDSSQSSSSEQHDEVVSNLMEELEITKGVNTELSNRLLKVESENSQLLKIQSDYKQLLESMTQDRTLKNETAQSISPGIKNIPTQDDYTAGLSEHCNSKSMFKKVERPFTVETSEVNICAYCGKRIKKNRDKKSATVGNCPGGCRRNIILYNTYDCEKRCNSKKNKRSVESAETICINNVSMTDLLPYGNKQKEAEQVMLELSELKNPLDFKRSEWKNIEYEHLFQTKERGTLPVMYFIYELIGLSLPSQNMCTGEQYNIEEIELYCNFLQNLVNIGIFKKEFYDKHNGLAEKELLGCYKLNKIINSLGKLKHKLNTLKCHPENGNKERMLIEKQILMREERIHHGKAMLEVIRAQRIELLKYIKRLRTNLVRKFHEQCLQGYLTKEDQEMENRTKQNITFHGLDNCKNGLKTTCNQRHTNVLQTKQFNGYLFQQPEHNSTILLHLSPQKKYNKLKKYSEYEENRLKLISRSDTVVNTIKFPKKIKSMISNESLLPSLTKIYEKTKIISSEESYFSYKSGVNSLDPSSGISSLSEGISLEPTSSNSF